LKAQHAIVSFLIGDNHKTLALRQANHANVVCKDPRHHVRIAGFGGINF
jgi:hypothetical protein